MPLTKPPNASVIGAGEYAPVGLGASVSPPNGVGSFRSYIGGASAAGNYRSSDTPTISGSATWGLPGQGIYYSAISHWQSEPRKA